MARLQNLFFMKLREKNGKLYRPSIYLIANSKRAAQRARKFSPMNELIGPARKEEGAGGYQVKKIFLFIRFSNYIFFSHY